MHALDVLGDPVRRRILELLADDRECGTSELSAGEIGEIVQQEFGISQPAVSQHLRVLREHGFASVRAEGRRRLYAVDARGPRQAREWLTPFERFWLPALDALGTELARGTLQRRRAAASVPSGIDAVPSGIDAIPSGIDAVPSGADAAPAGAPDPARTPAAVHSPDHPAPGGPPSAAPHRNPPSATPRQKET